MVKANANAAPAATGPGVYSAVYSGVRFLVHAQNSIRWIYWQILLQDRRDESHGIEWCHENFQSTSNTSLLIPVLTYVDIDTCVRISIRS